MNNVTKEKISMAVIKACEDEKLMYKEAAKVFNTEPLYMTYLKNPKYWDTIPGKIWDKFHTWLYSGKKLKEYKMPKNFEEERQLADACLVNRMNEEMGALLMAGERVTLPYPSEEPRIKVKTEALAKRKKELAEKKPRKKYTRKPKENTPDYAKAIRESRPASTICDYVIKRTTPEVTEKILADAPVPAHKYVAEAVPEGTPFVSIPEQKIDAIGLLWLKICPERQMIDAASIQSIADECDVPFDFVKAVIEKEIEYDQQLIASMEQTKKEPDTDLIPIIDVLSKSTALSEENTLLKSEIKTLTFLLAEEHKANEVLRAENGYLNLMVSYKDKMIEVLEKSNAMKKMFWDSLRASYSKYKSRGFWARVFNRPVK